MPNNLFKEFNIVSKLFSKYNVFLEIAVPIILTGLDKYNLNENINGSYYWNGELFELEKDYYNVKHFGHPFKLSLNLVSEKRKLLCQYFIQEKFINL